MSVSESNNRDIAKSAQLEPEAPVVVAPAAKEPATEEPPEEVITIAPIALPGSTNTIYPVTRPDPNDNAPSVFLAGSIDMGEAINWQAEITESLATHNLGINVFNPRRPKWDSSWVQDIDFKPFFDQVDWELEMLEKATVIAMYLPAKSKAPISLLELGLFTHGGRLIVGCPKEFWRRGNVEIVCKRYNVKMVETLEDLVKETLVRLAAFEDKQEAEKARNAEKAKVTEPSPTTTTKGGKDAKPQAQGAHSDGINKNVQGKYESQLYT